MSEQEFKNELKTDNFVGEKDDVALGMLKDQEKMYLNEISVAENGAEQAQKDYDNYKEQWDVQLAKVKVMLDNWGMIEEKKTHMFHLKPEYWEAEKKLFEYQHRMDVHTNEANLNQFLAEKENYLKQVEIAKENLAKVQSQIAEVEK